MSRVIGCTILVMVLGLTPVRADEPGGLFVAVGHKGVRLSSTDGINWQHEQTGKDGEAYRAVVFGNGHFAAIGSYGGSNIFASTADGITWKTSIRDAKYANYLRGLFFGHDKFLGLGGDPGAVGDSRPFLMESADGETWSDLKQVAGKNILRRAAFGNGFHVAVGDRGRRSVSTDGYTWKDVPDTKAVDTLVNVAFGNGIFVGVGLHGLRTTTTDGVKWANTQLGEEGEHLNSIIWADNRFVAIGHTVTFTSPDGVAWQRHETRDGPTIATYGKGIFIGSSWKGRILHSNDALTWKQVHKSEHHIEALAFGAGR